MRKQKLFKWKLIRGISKWQECQKNYKMNRKTFESSESKERFKELNREIENEIEINASPPSLPDWSGYNMGNVQFLPPRADNNHFFDLRDKRICGSN